MTPATANFTCRDSRINLNKSWRGAIRNTSIPNPQPSISVISNSVNKPFSCNECCVLLSTTDLLDKNVETAETRDAVAFA
jgi:hypothetical protein